jgi:exonuclease SbcD
LQVPHIYVGDRLQTYVIPTRAGPLQIVTVPWPRRSGMLTREESRGLSIEDIRKEIQDRMTEAIQDRVQGLDAALPAILAGHVTINGATVGTERAMMLGRDHELLPSAVHKPQLDYVALGHIHKHQVLRYGPPVVYSGSLQRVDFSEEGEAKGFCVVDLDLSAPQGQRLADFQFQQVKARPFVTIDVKVLPGEAEPTQAVLRAIAQTDVADAVVRVRVTLPAELAPQLREGDIREALKPAHYIAAISREVEGTRRTRLGAAAAQGLQPMEALRSYLASRRMEPRRQEALLRYAEELMAEESARPDS